MYLFVLQKNIFLSYIISKLRLPLALFLMLLHLYETLDLFIYVLRPLYIHSPSTSKTYIFSSLIHSIDFMDNGLHHFYYSLDPLSPSLWMERWWRPVILGSVNDTVLTVNLTFENSFDWLIDWLMYDDRVILIFQLQMITLLTENINDNGNVTQ